MVYCYLLTFFSSDVKFNNTGKILSEIIYETFAFLPARHRKHSLMCPNCCSCISRYFRMYTQYFSRSLVIIAVFKADGSIIDFTIIEICCTVTAAHRNIPVCIGFDKLCCPILVLNPKFKKQCLSVSTNTVLSGKHKRTYRPASANNSCKLVILFKCFRHIIGLILQPCLIGCKTRCKKLISNLTAV